MTKIPAILISRCKHNFLRVFPAFPSPNKLKSQVNINWNGELQLIWVINSFISWFSPRLYSARQFLRFHLAPTRRELSRIFLVSRCCGIARLAGPRRSLAGSADNLLLCYARREYSGFVQPCPRTFSLCTRIRDWNSFLNICDLWSEFWIFKNIWDLRLPLPDWTWSIACSASWIFISSASSYKSRGISFATNFWIQGVLSSFGNIKSS